MGAPFGRAHTTAHRGSPVQRFPQQMTLNEIARTRVDGETFSAPWTLNGQNTVLSLTGCLAMHSPSAHLIFTSGHLASDKSAHARVVHPRHARCDLVPQVSWLAKLCPLFHFHPSPHRPSVDTIEVIAQAINKIQWTHYRWNTDTELKKKRRDRPLSGS